MLKVISAKDFLNIISKDVDEVLIDRIWTKKIDLQKWILIGSARMF